MLGYSALRPVYLGLAYFAVAFCAGAVLGTFRTLIVEPRIGPLAALFAELPLILAVAWYAARAIYFPGVARLDSLQSLALSGLIAFITLLLADILLALFLLGRTGKEILSHWASMAGMIGLGAQALFGAIPALQGILLRRNSRPK